MIDNLERLHRALGDAMRSRGDDFEKPITVSQIYQELVPYRVARTAIGFEMNADYEFALLRLLAGDRDLARLEPPEVRAMLRKEMDSPNPNVSLFRAYANCDVWITPPEDWIAELFAEEPANAGDPDEFEVEFEPEVESESTSQLTGAPVSAASPPPPAHPRPRFVPDTGDEPDAPAAQSTPAAAPPASAARPHQCAFCGGNLPATRLVNFCPHCGNDLTQQPCSSCGEILEANWRFCVNCGTPAPTYDAQAN